MKHLAALICLLAILSCSKERDLTVKGHIEGLKKGTIYLEKQQDSTIVTVDSVALNGSSDFILYSDIETPEAFYLSLDKNNQSKPDEKIVFFADKGITEINSTLKNFMVDAKINGSEQQKLYEDYLKVITRYKDKNLELIKEEFEAKKAGDSALIEKNIQDGEKLLKSKYLFTVNFAINNKDSEVAPYVTLTEIYDAQTKWLDTIYQSLTPKVQASKYGKMLEKHIADNKE